MNQRIKTTLLGVAVAVLISPMAYAEETVKLSEMHLCCGACVKGVEGAVEKIEGASVKVDKDAGTAVVTAADKKTAQRAVRAIGRAGFHGKSDHAKIKMPENSGVKKGNVKRLELIGIHNCCGGCNKAIKKALGSVDGVASDTATPKKRTLVVEGDFDAMALVEALNKAGFHVREKGAAKKAVAERKKKTGA